MDFQFTPHAIERLLGRYGSLVAYGEVQAAVSAKCANGQLRKGDNEVLVKTLPNVIEVKDETALNGRTRGTKVMALLHVNGVGAFIDTIVLR